MKPTIKEWLDESIEKLKAGKLTEADLRDVTAVLVQKSNSFSISILNQRTYAHRLGDGHCTTQPHRMNLFYPRKMRPIHQCLMRLTTGGGLSNFRALNSTTLRMSTMPILLMSLF